MILSWDTIQYGDHIVLTAGRLSLKPGTITVITGESGSGKTSLFRTLLHHAGYRKVLSGCPQFPEWIEELTIQEHFDLIRTQFSADPHIEEYIDRLGCRNFMSLHPAQCSGGEQRRLAFLLCLLKETPACILDEPTASVNAEYVPVYMQILEEEKNRGRAFLIFTHDKELSECADQCMVIEGKRLNAETLTEDACIDLPKTAGRTTSSGLLHALRKVQSHSKLYIRLIPALLTVLCVVTAALAGYSQTIYRTQQNILSHMHSNELVAYRAAPYEKQGDYTSYEMGLELPLNDADLQTIRSLEHVTDAQYRVDLFLSDYEMNCVIDENYNSDVTHTPLVFTFRKDGAEKEYTAEAEVTLSTYDSSHKQVHSIQKDFDTEGIYLSRNLANSIEKACGWTDDDLKGMEMEFLLNVPVYTTYGRWSGPVADTMVVPAYSTTVERALVQIPIAGILEWSSFGLQNFHQDALYIERSILFQHIEALRKTESRKIYMMDLFWKEFFIGELPEGLSEFDTAQVMEDMPWQPMAVSVYADGIESVPLIAEELTKNGFAVISEYTYDTGIMTGVEAAQKSYTYAAAGLSAVLILLAFFLARQKNKQSVRMHQFLRQAGFPFSLIHNTERKLYLQNTCIHLAIGFLLTGCFYGILSSRWQQRIVPPGFSIVLMIVLLLLCHAVIPFFMQRKSHDYTA